MKKLKTILKEQQIHSSERSLLDVGASDELLKQIQSWSQSEWNKIKRSRQNWYQNKYVGIGGGNPNDSKYNVTAKLIGMYWNAVQQGLTESYLPNNNTSISLRYLIEQNEDSDWTPESNNATMRWVGIGDYPTDEEKEIKIYSDAWSKKANKPALVLRHGEGGDLLSWEWLEIAKLSAKDRGVTIPKDFYEALEYLTKPDIPIASIRPATTYQVLLRGSDEIVYFMDYCKGIGICRTEWSHATETQALDPKWVWDNSVYVGKQNEEWFEKFPVSQQSKTQRSQLLGPMDRVIIELILASTGWATSENYFLNQIKKIKNKKDYEIVNDGLKSVESTYQKTHWDNDEIIYVRQGKAHLLAWAAALKFFNDKNAWDIFGRKLKGGIPHVPSMILHAAVPDWYLHGANIANFKNGLPDLIRNEMDPGIDRDNVLRVLVKNNIYSYNSATGSAVTPDGDTLAFYQSQPDL